MKKYLFSAIIIVALGMAAPASAQFVVGAGGRQPQNQIGPIGCPYMSVDQCFTYGDWWGTSVSPDGGLDSYCSLTGGCWTCLANIYGKQVCSYGVSSGGCNCEMQQVVGAGPGIENCVPSGNCQISYHS